MIGLVSAIKEELPDAEHRRCGKHIYQAWAKKWRGEERRKRFRLIAKSSFKVDLKDNLKELAKLDNGICEDLLAYPVEDWVGVYHSPYSKCNVLENNMCETFN